jgi:hypothetical protein
MNRRLFKGLSPARVYTIREMTKRIVGAFLLGLLMGGPAVMLVWFDNCK